MNNNSMFSHLLNFTKIEHTTFSLPLIFTGAWLGGGGAFPSLRVLALIVMAAVGGRIFGMAMNRVLDRHIDRLNPRTAGRELPAGKIGLKTALMVAVAGLLLYLLACLLLGGWCLILAPIPLIPLLGYSLLKRFTPLCHYGIGLCLALAPLGAWVATAGHPHFSSTVLLFALFVFCWLAGSDIIYALMDEEHDRRHGIHSLPAWLGGSEAVTVAAVTHLIALVVLVLVVMRLEGGPLAWISLTLAAIFFLLMYLPAIPVQQRFFPISTLAGIAGALAPMVG